MKKTELEFFAPHSTFYPFPKICVNYNLANFHWIPLYILFQNQNRRFMKKNLVRISNKQPICSVKS
ncbi:MAG: hypothetical protein D6732_08905, partial [Methanobacteriota archaeon]